MSSRPPSDASTIDPGTIDPGYVADREPLSRRGLPSMREIELPREGFASRHRRSIFLGISALCAFAVVALAHAVMLPFVLALVIAYVLTPLVAWVEARKVPRGAAIILVYLVVLGVFGGFVRAIAPRVGHELIGLRHELPARVVRARDEWVPAIQKSLEAWGLTPPAPPPDKAGDDLPPIVMRPLADGSTGLEMNGGLELTPDRHGGFVLHERDERPVPFDFDRFVSDAIGKSFSYVQRNALELARIGRDVVAGLSRAIFVTGITLMLAAYIMLTRERILRFFVLLARPSLRKDMLHLLGRIDRGLSGVVRGQLIICLLNGGLSAIGFAFVGLKYWPVLALVATVLSLIPIFGSIVSAVPAVALGLTQSFGTALFVLAWIVGIHQLEANLLNPKIMGDAAKIHPVLVVFSLLVGEHFFQTAGALLAVPTMSVAQSVFLHFREVVQRSDPEFAGDPRASLPPPLRHP